MNPLLGGQAAAAQQHLLDYNVLAQAMANQGQYAAALSPQGKCWVEGEE